jgi:uncharacterized protein (DUF885 family)
MRAPKSTSGGILERALRRVGRAVRPLAPRPWRLAAGVALGAALLAPGCAATAGRGGQPSASSGANDEIGPDDAAIAEAGEAFVALVVATSPESATTLGIHRRDTELDDRSAPGVARILAVEEQMLAELRARFASPRASQRARTDLRILVSALEVDVRLRRETRPTETQPELYASPLGALYLMMARDYAPASERAAAAVARLEKIPAVIASAKANLKSPPRVWTTVGISAAGGAAGFLDELQGFLLASLPNDQARVAAAVAGAKAAYADYRGFLERDVLPRSTGSFAAGKPLFEFLLKENYFLEEGADELEAMGSRVLGETEAKLAEVARRIDPAAAGWPEVVKRVKGNHPTAAELLPSYRREVARARQFLVARDVVSFPEGDDCEVVETPQFQRSTITAAYDQPPPYDATTRGFFFVTPVDPALPPEKREEMLRENDHGDQVDTAVHEVYPGHHLQLSWARRHPSTIRKVTGPSIFAEGWALYAEELMSELGYYTDEERLMQLEWALVRAARVVLDVGLHTRGMTYEQAVRVLVDRVHLEPSLAESEVKRYTSTPTQPLSYLVGREMLFKLRERYKARAGAAYSLKAFHDEVLSHGTIAPGLLASELFGEAPRR